MRRADRLTLPTCIAAALLALCPLAAHAQGTLRAHEITYRFTFHGLNGGDLRLTLTPGAHPGSWLYETRSDPSFLARLVVSPDSRERSWFDLTPAGVRPERYLLEDGSSSHKDSSDLRYDYGTGHLTGTARGAPLDLPIETGLQDVMTIRIAPTIDLLAGRDPGEYVMLDGREIKRYVYRRVGTEKLETALGTLDTVVVTSDRKGSDGRGRTWRYWYAPSLDYLTVRAEQRDGGDTRLALAVKSLKWLDARPAPAGTAGAALSAPGAPGRAPAGLH